MGSYHIIEPTLMDIAREIPRVRKYCFDEQENLWNNTVREFRKHHCSVPLVLWQLTSSSFLIQVGEDRTFCEESDIPYNEIDKHWCDVRAAAALWYYDQIANA